MARKKINRITIADVELVAVKMAKKLMEWDETIPAFDTRYPNILESCLSVPFQTFAKRSPYRGVEGRAAILFYLMIKNHPFQNGNKRIAVTTLLTFLFINDLWIVVTNKELYEFARDVAKSDPTDKENVVDKIEVFINKHETSN